MTILRGLEIWGAGYLRSRLRGRFYDRGPWTRHLLFCVADHFEPFRGGVSTTQAQALTSDWCARYTEAFDGFRDADGRRPQHTFFSPADEYDAVCVDYLAGFCAAGWGETEIQLHHRNDNAADLADRLATYRDRLRMRHGLLGCDRTGGVRYGFVHGNWALCNSRPDGDWCGVSGELSVLAQTGCYADFTFPSAPSATQPRTVNALYRATDHQDGRPRGHDRGKAVRVVGTPRAALAHGRAACPDQRALNPVVTGFQSLELPLADEVDCYTGAPHSLLLVQGPLALDWRRRKWGLLPRLENGELSGVNPPDARRAALWAAQHIHVIGRPEWVFVKVHTHGCVPANREIVLGAAMQSLHRELAEEFNDGERWRLHYVSARETYNLIRAAECGHAGDPNPWRDFEIAPPPY